MLVLTFESNWSGNVLFMCYDNNVAKTFRNSSGKFSLNDKTTGTIWDSRVYSYNWTVTVNIWDNVTNTRFVCFLSVAIIPGIVSVNMEAFCNGTPLWVILHLQYIIIYNMCLPFCFSRLDTGEDINSSYLKMNPGRFAPIY